MALESLVIHAPFIIPGIGKIDIGRRNPEPVAKQYRNTSRSK
jgi:hypothetical protein